ncbi:bifunctional DNA-formamidopyrimidine glycosylase/DNA-(apurinic or apyrimidinic site) lyase [Acidothermaceae bacterium B102]|nr:bifunctional DNA-formamidopyrimidine glycosylase/DNA-(apurinic or apyrimidinic site) lyase [Acidothermaceae bacterium B102]
MPELPEVETVRRGLEHTVVGRRVASVQVLHDRAVRRHVEGGADFAAALTGRTLLAARRRGKYLWLPLDSGDALITHLGMSGQLVALSPDAPDGPHLRVRLTFDDGGLELRFVDQRTFGGMQIDPGGAELPHPLEHIARDPFDPLFDDAAFVKALRARRTGIKRAMLDQTLVSGIGNMYADEALWRAKLHYLRPTASLTAAQVRTLLAAVREVMTEALAAGGTTFDGLYVNVNGQSGYFDVSLDAYGREGEPCHRCGTLIVREPFMNRSSFFCPYDQKRPRRPA